MAIFSRYFWWFCLNFSKLWRPSLQMKLHRWYLQENHGTHTSAPSIKYCDKTALTSQTHFIVVQHSVPNQQWKNSNLFLFQGNIVKVHHMRRFVQWLGWYFLNICSLFSTTFVWLIGNQMWCTGQVQTKFRECLFSSEFLFFHLPSESLRIKICRTVILCVV
jgi:hypothetical protein